ncbi:hypothetical protein [Microbacterium sp. 77mftsu3.1]|uniref:hypothetical protein n=1 Tax=Microbacterium sp. 77mftsu3.1 TaxID=1761802 RepID=UPI000379EBD7|nr:hypothetical protein [Microbacterium sp. 77mftsu3.1]SDH43074.1 hypothetical protein SAMN04488590_3325 [Microbacterium sp. 77mftsu3.1]
MNTATATATARKVKTPKWASDLGLDFSAYRPQVITVNREVAMALLALNTSNRQLSRTNVNTMVRQIEGGKYNTRTSNAIGISTEGALTDGQHRLNAIVETGVTMDLIIVTGCDKMAVLIPNAKPRSFSEYLRQHEISYATILAPMVKTLWMVDGPGARSADGKFQPSWDYGRSMNHITDAEFLDYLAANPIFQDYAKLGSALYSRIGKGLPARFLGAFCYFVDHHTDENGKRDREEFFDRLADGVGLEKGSPILAMRDVLAKRMEDGSDKFAVMQGKFIKAWNAYREGKKVTTLKFNPGGHHPDEMPAVK